MVLLEAKADVGGKDVSRGEGAAARGVCGEEGGGFEAALLLGDRPGRDGNPDLCVLGWGWRGRICVAGAGIVTTPPPWSRM